MTINVDNDKGFAAHEKTKAAPDADILFTHPFSSWERGLNENTNGLIRQYFAKGSNFEDIMDKDVDEVMDKLNQCP